MATEMLQYLDPDGLDETVLNIGQIKTSLEGQISELGESIEEEMQNLPYARPDGIYPDMTVGAVIGADSTAQWAQRESTGSGTATVRSVQGAAVGYNQGIQNDAQHLDVNPVFASAVYADGVITATLLNDEPNGYIVANDALRTEMVGHKLLMLADTLITSEQQNATFRVMYVTVATTSNFTIETNSWQRIHSFITLNSFPSANLLTYYNINRNLVQGDTVSLKNYQLFDLTQMFGSGNEPTTIAEFEQMYPEAYYPYSAPTLKPVQIAGIASTDAQGGELDAIEWTAQTLRAAGSVRDELTADELITRVGVVDLGTLNWSSSSNYFYAVIVGKRVVLSAGVENHLACATLTVSPTIVSSGNLPDNSITEGYGANSNLVFAKASAYTTLADFKAAMDDVMLWYELATPTTTPISPELPMTYKVQAGGSESIIVPDGEVSAAPVLTIAEPVNMSTELARIWAAIESLGYTRNAAQLSRPVSLADIGSIDEVQKDTTEIETIKEVKE